MDKVLGAYGYLAARFNEPSSHAAIAAVVALAGVNIDAGIVHDGLVTLSILFGAAGFFVKESKPL